MEELHIVHSFRKNPEEEVRFCVREYKDRHYLDIRLWFLPAVGGDFFPTKKGLTLSLEYLPELKKGIERAGQTALESPLQQTSNSVK